LLFPFTFTIFSSMNNVFPHKSKSSCPIKCSSRRFRFTQTYKNCFSAVTNVTRKCLNITSYRLSYCRSQWPRGLRLRSAAARLLRSWVRIPPGAWIFVCCECCVLSRTGLCNELITRLEESYRQWCVVVCDLETSRMRRPWPALGRSVKEKKDCLDFNINDGLHTVEKCMFEQDKQWTYNVTLRRVRVIAVAVGKQYYKFWVYVYSLKYTACIVYPSCYVVICGLSDSKYLTLRLLISYIYGAPILDVSRSHTTTQQSR